MSRNTATKEILVLSAARQESVGPEVMWAVRSRASLVANAEAVSSPRHGAVSAQLRYFIQTLELHGSCTERREPGAQSVPKQRVRFVYGTSRGQ